MNESISALMRELMDSPDIWGIQHIPPNCPLGPAGFVVNIGHVYFYGPDLETALRRALSKQEVTHAVPG